MGSGTVSKQGSTTSTVEESQQVDPAGASALARTGSGIISSGAPAATGSAPKSGLAAPPSGLAARRAAQGKLNSGLAVHVDKVNPRGLVLGQLQRAADNAQGATKTITKTDAFDKLYSIGAEVMPSVHPGMEIRNAVAVQDAQKVVVKVRRKKNSFASAQEEKEWRQSAEFMLNLPKSTSIAEIYGVWEDKDAYYIVMERIGGSDLFELLDAEGMLPLHDTRAILRQLLKGVAALHGKGCIHKDLKLENVMVDRSGSASFEGDPIVKLIDFDTAMTWEPDSPKAKTVLGTDQYISGEAYAGKYSPASDMFAVGVIAYKLITGQFPFNGKMFDDEAGENWVGSPKMKQIQERVQRARVNYNIPPFPSEHDAVDFVRKLLSSRDHERISSDEALAHPFLALGASPQSRRPSVVRS